MRLFRSLIPRFAKTEFGETVRNIVRDSLEEKTAAWAEDRKKLQSLQARLDDAEAAVGQVQTILRRETAALPPPPKHLQVRVVGGYVPDFLESGFAICGDLNAALQPAGKTLADFRRILDWGCGCGRTTRALKTLLPACELHATDIDPEAIAWLQENYAPLADFRVSPHLPPTPYADGMFDFVFGISIFTHLPEDMQFRWLEELRRITRPGGYLVMTTSGGEELYSQLPSELRTILETNGFLYDDARYGQSISLPDFYQNTYHAHPYLRREWSKYFEILDIQRQRIQKHQDTVLMRRRE